MYKEKLKFYIEKFKTLKLETKVVIIVFCLAFLIGGFVSLWNIIYHKDIYQAAVMVRDQNNPDPIEDMKTSLKYGDVIVVKAENHKWSQTERVSYLILKIKLTKRQMNKLTQPEEKKIKKKELSEEQKRFLEENNRKAIAEIIRARKYRIDMDEFKNFKPLDLLDGQPFEDGIFGWGIVERK